MPSTPKVQTLNANSAEILNTIRSEASPQYQRAVPLADVGDIVTLRAIGKPILQYQSIQNEFVDALVNRIGMVIATSKLYSNPWAGFKRGILEYGESIEEYFVELCQPHDFNPATAETQVFKREIPDVKAAFHYLNFQKFYKQTISRDQLRQAFLSWDGVTDLISRIISAMTTSANYDEFQVMKYMVGRAILDNQMGSVPISKVNNANMRDITADIIAMSDNFTFMSTKYNTSGVHTFTDKGDQYLILNTKFNAHMNVEVLATSFNMDKAEFMGHVVKVDGFGDLDTARLTALIGNNAGFQLPTTAQAALLDQIPGVLVGRDWWMVFDNLLEMGNMYNQEGRYWNNWLHTWKIFSSSPFAQAVYFNDGDAAATAVTVTPSAVTLAPGASQLFSATVTGTGIYNPAVTWSVTGGASANTVMNNGALTVGSDETATSLTVTATSVQTTTVSGTATVTVS